MAVSRAIANTDNVGVAVDSFKIVADVDDTNAFVRAIAAGGAVFLAPRTYSISNLTVSTASVALYGEVGAVVQRNTNSNTSLAFISISSQNVAIEGITFDYNSPTVSSNQWGMLIKNIALSQTVSIRRCNFINNSGTLGGGVAIIGNNPTIEGAFEIVDCEITNVAWTGIYLQSVGNASVYGNYVHDCSSAVAMLISGTSGAPSSDVMILGNSVRRCMNGIQYGGIGAPYVYGTPTAIFGIIADNDVQDCANYGLQIQGDNIIVVGNKVGKSSASVTCFGGIVCNARWVTIANNNIKMPGTVWCIDAGGSQYTQVLNNKLYANTGNALNIGGSVDCRAAGNFIEVDGSTNVAAAVTIFAVEGDGNGVPFPYQHSGLVVENNKIIMIGGNSRGIAIFDDAGGQTGCAPNIIKDNNFTLKSSALATFCISYTAAPGTVFIKGNTVNGSSRLFSNPDINNDLLVPDVYDEVSTAAGASSIIRSVITPLVAANGAGTVQQILWVHPSNGGSNYNPATTTLSANGTGGGSGWTGSAQVSQGVIVGVVTHTVGSGYTGTVTIAATDSSGAGSGATFTVGNFVSIPDGREIVVSSSSTQSILKTSGGLIGLGGGEPIILMLSNPLKLRSEGVGSLKWLPFPSPPRASFAISSLPSPTSDYSGAVANVTGSTTGKWQARCNGTNWIWPDGTTVTV
jgi:hypothetical protein